ncbi:alpha/beta fold hydrolase [Phaeobacter sp. QD34_3]|uniref:alpha/beta fold hydrolase n=1 Tax=unclassified Phaeobacter TaxID=2621772 RepID=UPI00237EED92|nr:MULTISPECIES: alpha/beta fold hydrolase [unclassified Phaeobacter]MDE4133038.1 alpha/beta fold hydrolase [Phaeobacter sp. QD34_3]MDE4136560.1 alpha/beta fold hydrolase [Phaeobacter sp. QD34_24]
MTKTQGEEDAQTALIQAIYEVAIDPHVYDRMVDLWGRHLLHTLGEDLQSPQDLSPEVAEHLLRAFEILDRLGRKEQPAAAPLDLQPSKRAELRLSQGGKILDASPLAVENLGATVGQSVFDLALSPESATRLNQQLGSPASNDIYVFFAKGDKHPFPMVRQIPSDAAGACDVILTALHNTWTEAHDQTLRQMFGLTVAETRVARELLTGATLPEIASVTGRSVDTLRTQLKSIRRKTYTSNQQQLVRIMTGLEALIAPESSACENTGRTDHVFLLPDGRKMAYRCFGPDRGLPCLFIHNMLNGPNFPAALVRDIHRLGIRLICPIRPGFGSSDPDPVTKAHPKEAPDRFCADVTAFLKHLGHARVVAVGHMSGALYAYRLAQLHPDLVAGVFNISGAVPITDMRQIRAMHYRQQVMALTARFTPRMLPTLLRAGISQIDSGGVEAFLNALYRRGTPDRAIAERVENRDMLFTGFRQIIQQGHHSFAIDSYHVVRDWSRYCDGLQQPVTLIHGATDPVVTEDSVRQFAARMGFDAEVHSNVGQLVLYHKSREVLQGLKELAGKTLG